MRLEEIQYFGDVNWYRAKADEEPKNNFCTGYGDNGSCPWYYDDSVEVDPEQPTTVEIVEDRDTDADADINPEGDVRRFL